MPKDGIKMSLVHVFLLQSPSLSLLNLGWWPSATENTQANKSSSFQHLSGPNWLPTATTPTLVKMGLWLYSSFGIHPYSPETPFPDGQNIFCPMPKWRRDPLSPPWQKTSEAKMGLPAEMPGTQQGCPLAPFYFSPALCFIHPSLLLSFYILNTPLLWGHSLSSHPTLFIMLNSQAHIKTSSDSSERKQPDLAERDIRHGCQWPFCMSFVPLDVVEIDKQS